MTFSIRQTALGIAVAATTTLSAFSAHAIVANTQVDLELALLVDVSGSINSTDFNLQKQGYVDAFNSAAVQTAINAGTHGSIAVTLMYWSGAGQQSTAIDWVEVSNASDFATLINGTTRPYNSLTAPGSAINAITPTFASNAFDGTRQVIDVSGDGSENSGADTSDARDAALLAGIDTINGIYIGGSSLGDWYDNNIVGGTKAFSIQAANFSSFGTAIEQKLVAEITPTVPLPAPALMLIAGLGALGTAARKRKKA